MSEALKKAREALEALEEIANLDPDKDSEEGFNEWGEAECFRKAKDIARKAVAALAAIDAEAKPVVRMLTEAEFAECCGGCKVTSAAMTWMRRSVSKAAEVNGLTIGEQG